MRTEGFDHVRIPVGWHHYTGPGPSSASGPRSSAGPTQLVNAGLREGLGVMINIHHFDDFTSTPRNRRPVPGDLAAGRQALRESTEGLAFELLNEPKDAATTEVINPIFAEAIRQIRQVAPQPDDLRRPRTLEQHRRASQAAAAR